MADRNLMIKMQQGFTLIEVMIVIAIIGILASIALPAYQDYIARSQTTHAVSQVSSLRKKVYEYYLQEGGCPTNNTIDSIERDYVIPKDTDLSGEYIQKITTAGSVTAAGGCTITALFPSTGINRALVSKSLIWTLGSVDRGLATWNCTTDINSTAYKYIPPQCRNAISG